MSASTYTLVAFHGNRLFGLLELCVQWLTGDIRSRLNHHKTVFTLTEIIPSNCKKRLGSSGATVRFIRLAVIASAIEIEYTYINSKLLNPSWCFWFINNHSCDWRSLDAVEGTLWLNIYMPEAIDSPHEMEIMRQCAKLLARLAASHQMDSQAILIAFGAHIMSAHLNVVRVFIFIRLVFISLISLFRDVLNIFSFWFCFLCLCFYFYFSLDSRSSSHVYYFLWESFNLIFWPVYCCCNVILILFSTAWFYFSLFRAHLWAW